MVSLLVGLATLFVFGLNKIYNTKTVKTNFTKEVQEKFLNEISIGENDLSSIYKDYALERPATFNEYKAPSKYSYCIFKNKKLSYWSNNKFVPSYKMLLQSFPEGIIEQDKSLKLLKVKKVLVKKDTVDICVIIPLYRHYANQNDYLESEFNPEIFTSNPDGISKINTPNYNNIYGSNGKPLFSINHNKLAYTSSFKLTPFEQLLVIIFIITSLIFIITSFGFLTARKKYWLAILLSGIFLFLIRIVMMVSGIPINLIQNEAYKPVFMEGDIFSPTFLDSIVNAGFTLCFLFLVALYYFRTKIFIGMYKIKPNFKSILSVLLVLCMIFVSHFCDHKINELYENSMYSLGYSLNLNLSNTQVLSLFYFLFLFGIFFLIAQITTHVFIKLNLNTSKGILHWLYGFLTAMLIYFYIKGFSLTCVIAAVFFLICYLLKLPKYFYSLKFQTLAYMFFAALVFSLISVNIIHKQEKLKSVLDKKTFGKRYLAENDLLGEGLLARFNDVVKNDKNIINAFSKKELGDETIKQIVKDQLLDIYFDKYEVDVISFDPSGFSIGVDNEILMLDSLKSKFQVNEFKTDFKNIYFLNDPSNNFIKKYISFNEVYNNGQKIGEIVLDLKLKDEKVNNVYPELLLDKKYAYNPESKNYSYGIFDKNQNIIANSGSFNYQLYFKKTLLFNPEIYKKELSFSEYNHYAIKGQNNRTIVVSEDNKNEKTVLSNLSFLILVSIIGISIILLIFSLFGGKGFYKTMNFSTKIQLYLNAAVLLPLLVLIIITLSLIKTTLVSIQDKAFIDNTKNIASTVQLLYSDQLNGRSSQAFFENEVNNLARSTKIDLNIFDQSGKLNLSTRPLIYQSNLLSSYLNTRAYSHILEQKNTEMLTGESLGKLNYKSVYVAIKDLNNKTIGVLGIPFFDAKKSLDSQVKEVVSTLMIIFLILFSLLLITSFYASNNLTNPLRLIAQRLKRTNLDKLNESITWNSNDEIGMLTKSYNNMLKKLEESKAALSQSEKQTAWREMAKQVAHEIKNPLTPMKLSIQQLQRTLPSDDIKQKQRMERALNSLTEQIDNISEIANSFSEFAKMPIPKSEIFDMVPTVQKTVDLYSQNNNIKIDLEILTDSIMVKGDRLLLSRVVTNLIINGIQAVSPFKQAEIKVRVYKSDEENSGIVSVEDNGSGIPEDIRKKVFIPNFSTKIGGSGLGLAMAKRGIEHSGGNIWFDTIIDQGTTFFVDLPINQ